MPSIPRHLLNVGHYPIHPHEPDDFVVNRRGAFPHSAEHVETWLTVDEASLVNCAQCIAWLRERVKRRTDDVATWQRLLDAAMEGASAERPSR